MVEVYIVCFSWGAVAIYTKERASSVSAVTTTLRLLSFWPRQSDHLPASNQVHCRTRFLRAMPGQGKNNSIPFSKKRCVHVLCTKHHVATSTCSSRNHVVITHAARGLNSTLGGGGPAGRTRLYRSSGESFADADGSKPPPQGEPNTKTRHLLYSNLARKAATPPCSSRKTSNSTCQPSST